MPSGFGYQIQKCMVTSCGCQKLNGEPDCGLTNITGCIAKAINAVFKGIAQAALNPILDLLGTTALSTPLLADLPGIGELWNNSWSIVLAAYGILILVGGIVVMSHESLQARYSIKEIGPRIPVAFLASMLSLFFSDKLIRLANALSTAFAYCRAVNAGRRRASARRATDSDP